MKTTATTMTGVIAKSDSSITLPHPGSAWWVFSWGKDPSESSSLVTPIVESLSLHLLHPGPAEKLGLGCMNRFIFRYASSNTLRFPSICLAA
jgi:hypothetical protein